jgi:hypothetical protein
LPIDHPGVFKHPLLPKKRKIKGEKKKKERIERRTWNKWGNTLIQRKGAS